MEKMENKERFPLSHGTTTAISMDLLKKLLHLEFERSLGRCASLPGKPAELWSNDFPRAGIGI